MFGKEWENKVLEQLSDDEKRIYKEKKEHAINENIFLNPDIRITVGIIKGLERNLQKYGAEYCPCRAVSGDPLEDFKNVCPCVFHKKELEKDGICKCRLFVTREMAKDIIEKHRWNLPIPE